MQLLSLTLKGFRGIQDGLGLETLTLDFEALCDGAQLVAITGANGRGKSTVLDNMHPFMTMPSRVATAGAGGFSYYDHVYLPESEKDLTWALEGRCYRTQVVIRLNGRRRTEAYLSTLADDGVWRPVVLDDGTVSDGKVETYTRCVEHLCGSADTFFTSVFGAQGKRQLSDYRNGEIKTLLADLLAQDQIRELGAKASQTAKLLKAGLVGIRQELAVIVEDEEAAACGLAKAADAPARAQQAQFAASKAAERREELSQSCARLMAQRDQSRETDARRSQLQEERSAAQAADLAAIRDLGERERLDRQRLERLDQRCAQRAEQTRRRRERAQAAQVQCVALLSRAPLVERAVKRLPLAERVLPMRAGRLLQAREAVTAWESARSAMRLGEQRVEAIEREAGQAALRAQSLSRRFALTREVPCSGMALQGDCQLLADAREAKALIPSAEGVLQRLAAERTQALADVQLARGRVEATSSAEAQLQREEDRLERSRARASRYALLAGKAEEIAGTRLRLAEANEELKGTAEVDGDPEPARQEQEERECILASLRGIEGQRRTQSEQLQKSLARIDALLQALPMPFDGRALRAAEADRDRAAAQCEALQAAHLEAVRQSQALVELRRAQQQLGQRRVSVQRRAKRVEDAVADWTLLARCMSNDGLIALAIDDAGPALSGLANELLMACYGARFTVSIVTQAETAKGELREGFDIVVHDAESGESKSVRMMSGGERVWINECLVRAVALYLSQTSERRYATLFSDEADGALDPARKRMFGAMKREVLRIGGYTREFFISQTPELAGMADVVIDLEEHVRAAALSR